MSWRIRSRLAALRRRLRRGLVDGWRPPVGTYPADASVTVWVDRVALEFATTIDGSRMTADDARQLGQQLIEAAARIDGRPAQCGHWHYAGRRYGGRVDAPGNS